MTSGFMRTVVGMAQVYSTALLERSGSTSAISTAVRAAQRVNLSAKWRGIWTETVAGGRLVARVAVEN